MTLYTQVANNRLKTWVFLIIYTALLLAVGYGGAWYLQSSDILLIVGVIAIAQGFIGYWWSDSIALAISRAEPMDEKRYRRVYKIVENLSITAGLPMPRLYIIHDTPINAFATGRDPKHAAIAVTEGAIDKLNDNELSGVLAHELSHVGNEDIRLMSLVMVIGGMIALLSDFMLRSMWWGGGRRRDNESGNLNAILMLIAIVLALLAPLAATLIQLAISRKREFQADANGVLLTRYPEGLISALQKIEADNEPLAEANKATAHMYFSNPLSAGAIANLFSTHPPLEDRIAALKKGSGIPS
ncbi:M48 family metallopeptidase [Patescibacteria group bacterium]|nr:M48 family metallopeptidase [Patescibacteria group bacterium]